MELLGYADRRTCRPGEALNVMVSSGAPEVEAELIRFTDGSPEPPFVDAPSEAITPPVVVQAAGGLQRSSVGSRADLPLSPDWEDGGCAIIRCWIFPTTPGEPVGDSSHATGENVRMTGKLISVEHRRQVVWAVGTHTGDPSLALVLLPDGRVAVETEGAVTVATEEQLHARTWYGILVTIANETVTLDVSAAVGRWYTTSATARIVGKRTGWRLRGTNLMRLGSWRTDGPQETFNGKVARPGISVADPSGVRVDLLGSAVPLPEPVVADWDPSRETATDQVIDTGPHRLNGRTINLPTRAVTGPFWTAGSSGIGSISPQHDAIHFHADDVGELGWEPTLRLKVPEHIPSGVYAIRLSAQHERMHVPVYVRPVEPRARVAFLAPTNTYLAYANHRMFLGNTDLNHYIASHPVEPNERDLLVLEYPFLGRSIYDLHEDGSGVSVASWLRPLVSFEPAARDFLAAGPRHFAADLYILGWLERSKMAYEVLTDEDLHAEGMDALRPYDVVVTGSHPEYWSRPMMDGLQAYLISGGKLMYLGGNGFYWMTSFGPNLSYIEVRRGHQGTRAWDSDPGEVVHATTGEPGGLWRNLGVCPQSLVGVGMAAQGWGGGRGYRRLPDSFDPRVVPFFEGIGPDETIGSFGHVMCGAVGDEVDRMDHALGTPPHALRLATSETLPDEYQLVVEEVRNMVPAFGGTMCDAVRSDMVWFDLPGGGEVFSVGSVSWAAALGWEAGENNVSVLSTNVLRCMLARSRESAATPGDRQPQLPPG